MCKLWSVLFHPSHDDGGDDKDGGRQECPGDGRLLDCLRREKRGEGGEQKGEENRRLGGREEKTSR